VPDERIGYSSGWTVDEDTDGSFRWAATDPVDRGTRRVVTDGMRILRDPDGRLAALAAAATPGPRPPAGR
jgi:uncharacterized protein